MRRSLLPALLAAPLALPGLATALPPFGTTPVQSAGTGSRPLLYGISVARHPAFDRVVFRFRRGAPTYNASYVTRVTQDGSGLPVALAGKRFIAFSVQLVDLGPSVPSVLTPRFPMLRQMKNAGYFEAVASYGFGLSAKRGFRVFRLSKPTRVVLDVRH